MIAHRHAWSCRKSVLGLNSYRSWLSVLRTLFGLDLQETTFSPDHPRPRRCGSSGANKSKDLRQKTVSAQRQEPILATRCHTANRDSLRRTGHLHGHIPSDVTEAGNRLRPKLTIGKRNGCPSVLYRGVRDLLPPRRISFTLNWSQGATGLSVPDRRQSLIV